MRCRVFLSAIGAVLLLLVLASSVVAELDGLGVNGQWRARRVSQAVRVEGETEYPHRLQGALESPLLIQLLVGIPLM